MTTSQIEILGIDLGKTWFHVVGIDERGNPVFRKKLNRSQLQELAATLGTCVVAMEACAGSQFWGRQFHDAGHTVRIIPAQFVKPYLKSNKNDFNDAGAIAEAASRGSIRLVPLKSADQLELQAIHRVRQRMIAERTALVNQMRGLLMEHGIVVPVGRVIFSKRLPAILEDMDNSLAPRLRGLLLRLRIRWKGLDEEIDEVSADLNQIAKDAELCRRVSTVPGVGPIISTALVSAVGDASAFDKGRNLSAWLGLVPKQHSTGGRAKLGSISKRGNSYLRMLVIQGARALMIHMKREKSQLGEWLSAIERRSHPHVALVALANKIIRICWKVLTSGNPYQPFPTRELTT